MALIYFADVGGTLVHGVGLTMTIVVRIPSGAVNPSTIHSIWQLARLTW